MSNGDRRLWERAAELEPYEDKRLYPPKKQGYDFPGDVGKFLTQPMPFPLGAWRSAPPSPFGERGQQVMERYGGAGGVAEALRAMQATTRAPTGATPTGKTPEDKLKPPSFPTEPPPEGYRWELNEFNRWIPVFNPYAVQEPTELDPWQEAQRERWEQESRAEEERRQWEQQESTARQQMEYGYQQQMMAQQQQQMMWQQQEAERQYESQLAAQPRSWLEYSAYKGETPAIQPWMKPLMPQQYQGMEAGQQIPGWDQGMKGMPELTRPSRQYQARMGPTAMQQYGGYQQARTGIRPEELQFRLWSGAPPGGQRRGLTWGR